MSKPFCVLFDMDGVILDTEGQYDIIWKELGEKYNSEIDNFERIIKGTTLPNIIAKYFTHLSDFEKETLVRELVEREEQMIFEGIPGAFQFIEELKNAGIKIGLVTSSDDKKLQAVYNQIDLRDVFDTIVSANRITIGKPDPMCFLLAASDLGYTPNQCFVFEDSFAGIESGTRAGMKVIGLSTTNPIESLRDKCLKVIPDFNEFTMQSLQDMYG